MKVRMVQQTLKSKNKAWKEFGRPSRHEPQRGKVCMKVRTQMH